MDMKKKFLLAIAVSVLPCATLLAKMPTTEDLRRDILPLLLINDITDIRLAGLDLDEKHPIVDLVVEDLTPWGQPGESHVSLRVRFRATEDIYGREEAKDGEVVNLIRIGIAGKSYAARYEFEVRGETDEDDSGNLRTVFRFTRNPYPGDFSWEDGAGALGIGVRAAWEAQADITGETLRFANSRRDLE